MQGSKPEKGRRIFLRTCRRFNTTLFKWHQGLFP